MIIANQTRVYGQVAAYYIDGQPHFIEVVGEDGRVILAAPRPQEPHPLFADVRVDPVWWPERYRAIRGDEVPRFARNLQAALQTLVSKGLISTDAADILAGREHALPRFYVPSARGRAVLLDHVLVAARHIDRAAEG